MKFFKEQRGKICKGNESNSIETKYLDDRELNEIRIHKGISLKNVNKYDSKS